jgi:hypothetical protein
MTTAATFISTDHITTHHGQASGVQLIGDMDNPPRNAGDLGQQREPNVMNTSANIAPPPPDTKTPLEVAVSGERAASSSQDNHVPSIKGNEMELLAPLRLCQKSKTL